MNRFVALLAAGLLAPAAAAQTKGIQDWVNKDLDAVRKAERTEDVEVLRRILNKALHLPDKAVQTRPYVNDPFGNLPHQWGQLGGTTGSNPYVQPNTGFQQPLYGTQFLNATTLAAPQIGPFDGVYLPGHGVTYTLRVPEGVKVHLDPVNKSAGLAETCAKCHGEAPKETAPAPSAAKPASEWDRTVGELRGQKPAEAPKPAATAAIVCEPGRLTERVIGKLWGNVKHVRHLPAGEHVTVVVTFEGYTGSSRPAASVVDVFQDPAVATDRPAVRGVATETTGDRVAGFTDEQAKKIREGDRHLEEGRAAEAVTAYLTALEVVGHSGPVKVPAPELTKWKQRFPAVIENVTRGVAEVRRKLAHASTAAGNPGDAKTFLAGAANVTLEADPSPRVSGQWYGTRPLTLVDDKGVPAKAGFTVEESNQLTLGDLHLRQNKPKEAVDAYQRGLARYTAPVARTTLPANLPAAQAKELTTELEKGVRDAYRRLAQAWLAVGDADKAAAALELARTFTVVVTTADGKDRSVPVPAKLILSVARADALKAEDDLTAFRKAVTVETVGFPPPGGKAKQ